MRSLQLLRAAAVAAALGAAGVALTGCAKPPRFEIEAAQSALDRAKAAGAETYAADAYSHAQGSLALMRAEMAAQAGKWSLFRSYDKARQLATRVQGDADRAKAGAEAGKAQVQQEAQSGIEAARSSLADAVRALSTAPPAKDSRADLDAMKANLDALKSLETQAEAAFTSGGYAVAKQRSEQVRQQAMAIQADIAAARAKAHKA
jgi:hypothetical protein